MRVLVTGSTGMVGRNLLEHPGLERHDLLTPGRGRLDLLDGPAVRTFMADARPELVVHCAGLVGGIQANLREPARFLVENLEMGKNVVMGAHAAGVPRLLNLGSSCMYPRDAVNPLVEDAILSGTLEPTNEGYALAKIAVERLCAYVRRENPARAYKTIIPPNLYGRWDDFSEGFSHMVPAAIRKVHAAVRKGATDVEVWGTGQARREFMYAGDLADFLVFAMEAHDRLPQRMNVGLGQDHTIDEYYEAIAGVVGFTGGLVHDTSKPEGMARKLVDVSAMRALGWSPPTSLAEGLRRAYEFFLEQEAAQ